MMDTETRRIPMRRELSVQLRLLMRRDWSLPNFIIFGAQKGGTTSLYANLVRHPQVLEALRKEVHYFDWYGENAPFHYGNKNIDWYRAHFASEQQLHEAGAITGEATPVYLSHPQIASDIRAVIPDVKLVVMVRNPVKRTYSQYQMYNRNHAEPISFETMVRKELDVLTEYGINEDLFRDYVHLRHHKGLRLVVLRSIYVEQLRAWYREFPRENLLCIQSEDYFAKPTDVLNQVTEFLGISPWTFGYKQELSQKGTYQPINPDIASELRDFFKPYNKALFDLIGQEYDW